MSHNNPLLHKLAVLALNTGCEVKVKFTGARIEGKGRHNLIVKVSVQKYRKKI